MLVPSGPRVQGGLAFLKVAAGFSYFRSSPICETNIVGVITTDDGAQVAFETRGYGMVPDPTQAHLWEMPAVVQFRTESPAYLWMNTTLAIWEGTFNMQTGVHIYEAYSHQREESGATGRRVLR